MSKPARGTKRVCPSCGARFYDLSRTPIVCPVCQAVYQVTPPHLAARRARAPVEPRKVVVEPEVEAPSCSRAAKSSAWKRSRRPEPKSAIEEDEEIVDLGDDAPEIPAPATTTTPSWKKKRKARPMSRALSGRRAKRPEVGKRTPSAEAGSASPRGLAKRISLEPRRSPA